MTTKKNELLEALEEMGAEPKDKTENTVITDQVFQIKHREIMGHHLDLLFMGEPFLTKGSDNKPNKVKKVEVMDLTDKKRYSFLISEGSALDKPNLVGTEGLTITTQRTSNGFDMHIWDIYTE